MRILTDTLLEEQPTHVLQQKAFMLEREKAAVLPAFSPNKIMLLENLFDSVYKELQPTFQDYRAREDAVKFVDGLVRDKVAVGYIKKQFGLCRVRAFGSFTMDMFTPTSDLDLSLNVEYGVENLSREENIKMLRRLTKILYGLENGGGYVRDIQPVLRAKVPVVKFVHCKTGIECDVSAENRDGIIKSDILRILSSLDWRFRKLCFLVKAWANGHGINNSKDGTLNSLSIILLVAFHLQTRTPAILPPFSAFLEGLPLPATSDAVSVVEKRVQKFQNFGRNNTESVVQLFHSLLIQLVSVKDLWQEGLCASTYEGTWISASKPGFIFVEDFTALTQNAARAVRDSGFDGIYKCLHKTGIQISKYLTSLCDAYTLKSQLFSPSVKTSINKHRKRHFKDDDAVQIIGNQKKSQMGMVEPHNEMHHTVQESRIFSEIADWLSFDKMPRHEVLEHGVSRAEQAAFEDTHAPLSTTGSASIQLQGEHPAKKFKSHEVIYEDRHIRHLRMPNSLSSRQPNQASISLTQRTLEPSFGDDLIHYNNLVSRRLQDRQSTLVTTAAPTSFQEATLWSQLRQPRPIQQYAARGGHPVIAHVPYSDNDGSQLELLPPGLRTKALGPYNENMRAAYSSLYRIPASSYASSQHEQYNRLYDSNLSHRMHFPQGYEESVGRSTQYGTYGRR